MKAAIHRHALELGFDDSRVTTAQPPTHPGQFPNWLEAKRNCPMGRPQGHPDKRRDSQTRPARGRAAA